MSKPTKEPSDLVFHRNVGEAPTWNCANCGEVVHTQVDGASMSWVIKAQAEHECPNDVAKAMLPHLAKKIKGFLDELGVSIEIHEDSCYSGSNELMLVDNKTQVSYLLETEKLG